MRRGRARGKAAYTISELSEMSGMNRGRIRRMLEHNQVQLTRIGRAIVVFRSSLRQSMPEVWDSLVDLQASEAEDAD